MESNRTVTKRLAAVLLLPFLAVGPASGASRAPLADAAEQMDRATLSALLQKKADVNAAQVDGMTALHWAVYHDDVPLVRQLLAVGANAKAANRYQVMPLSLACTNGNTEIVQLLLDAGADPNTRLRGGETVLMTAARTGRPGPVEALLAHHADVNAKESKGQTALMWAADEGHAKVVEVLLAAGSDFRTPLHSGFTPLLFAAREGRIDVVRLLLKVGADVNEAIQTKPATGWSPSVGTSPLILAIENGHFELAVVLLKAGADPNDVRSGYSPLHTLSWVRKPNRGDGEDGQPPPNGSGNLTSLQFVKELVAHGANVNLQLKKGSTGKGALARVGATPFLMAAATADAALMSALVEGGADPGLPNADKCTPLLAVAGVSVRSPNEEAGTEPEVLEALELALKLGADINAVDNNGETAMHGAAYRCHSHVVQFLADHGAKPDVWNRKNKQGWTPLDIAEGHRFGNFRPSPETIVAFQRVMKAQGISPTTSSAPAGESKDNDSVKLKKPGL